MQKTKIEWVINPDGSQGFTSNPIRGQCKHLCKYCYAERIRLRFKQQPAEMSWHPAELEKIERRKKPATFFMGSMYDIFGEWVSSEKIAMIIKTAINSPQHTFIFLTKNPRRYPGFILPENCWAGYSDDGLQKKNKDWSFYSGFKNQFISFEPLIGDRINIDFSRIDWAIIGALTDKKGRPVDSGNKDLIFKIIADAHFSNTPIFIKNSLYKLYPDLPRHREIPYLK